jgi:4-hydroxybenzoate polyprenyltransferase
MNSESPSDPSPQNLAGARSQPTFPASRAASGGIMPWLKLLRVSALPSAISNILMAYLVAHQSWTPTLELGLLILASSSLYLAGMVLNDVYDFDVDLKQRPNRPLPAGQISKQLASGVGFGLLIVGILFACVAGWMGNHGATIGPDSPLTRAILISAVLAIFIVLYDGPLKKTILAPLLMGGCRSLNILLGASTFIPLATGLETATPNLLFGMPLMIWWIAAAVGILVAGVTLLGRREAVEVQPRLPLILAGLLILASLIGLAAVVYCPAPFEIADRTRKVFPLFLGIISLTILRRVIEAIAVAKPKPIQAAVISVLRSLIIFDAAICYLTMPHSIGYAMAVLSLLVPTFVLARFVRTT